MSWAIRRGKGYGRNVDGRMAAALSCAPERLGIGTMIINHTFRFIFVHVPKAAGTSVTSVLSQMTTYRDQEIGGTQFGEAIQTPYRSRFGLGKHCPAAEIRNVVGDVTWKRYFSFAFVRNPFARCFSTYRFLRGWDGINPDVRKRILAFGSFDEYVQSGILDDIPGPDDIFRPQVYWLRSRGAVPSVIVDFVGRVENLDADMRRCLDTIGSAKLAAAFSSLPVLNASEAASHPGALMGVTVDRILRKYDADFGTFGYSRDPARLSGAVHE